MNNRLERYLAEVSKRLGGLPRCWRTAELTEIRQHIADAIAARQGYGVPESAATDEALQQFGDARTVARNLRKTYWRGLFRRLDTPVSVLPLAALAMLAAWYLSVLVVAIIHFCHLRFINADSLPISQWGIPPDLHGVCILIYPASHLVVGAMLGYAFPRYGILAAFCGQLTESEILSRLPHYEWHVFPGSGVIIFGNGSPATLNFYVSAIPFVLSAMFAAYLGRWWTHRLALRGN
jgi:hypothetical protein